MIPELPVEIHRKIYAMACMDDGSTGCALSLVSRNVREVSAEFRWYSLAVNGRRPMHRLLMTLMSVPVAKSKVAHLYISDIESFVKGERRHRGDLFGLLDDFNSLGIDEGGVGDSIMLLLRLLRPTLETLSLNIFTRHITSNAGWSTYDEEDGEFLRGAYELPTSSTFAPNLRLLNLADESLDFGLEERFALNHPEMTHMRISRFLKIEDHEATILRLASAFGVCSPPVLGGDGILPEDLPLLPEGPSRFFLVEPGPTKFWGQTTIRGRGYRRRGTQASPGYQYRAPRGYNMMMVNFSNIGRAQPNFVLLPTHPGRSKWKEAQMSKVEWLDRIEGGPGCWVAPGKKISGI